MEGKVILRVISGVARGLRLQTLKGMNTRPTTDRVKETLFNIIREKILDANVLDLFSGSGSLGIEALSRGATSCVFVDRSRECASIISANLKHTGFVEKGKVFCADFKIALKKLGENQQKFQIIFLDPPYDCGFIEQSLKYAFQSDVVAQDALIVVEKSRAELINCQWVEIFREEVFGNTVICLLRNAKENVKKLILL